MKTPVAIIYARVSTSRQADDGLPIASQVEQASAKAEALGAVVCRVFKDEGISGRTSRRPAFQEAIAYCAGNTVDYFIVWNTSRFARNRVDAASYKNLLRGNGTKVVYAAAEIDGETDEGWFSESIFEVVDEHYSRVIARDTRRSMMKNARDGFFNGGRVPFGYRAIRDGKRKRLDIEESEAGIVRDVFRWFLGGSGTKEIAMRLNEHGISRRGAKWSKSNVALVLKNHAYTGHVMFNRVNHADRVKKPESQWVKTKAHPSIVSEEDFVSAQKLFEARSPMEGCGSPHSKFVFTGMLRCGRCGSAFQTESAKGRGGKIYHYYNCSSAQKGTGCQHRRIRADELDEWMMDAILNRVFTPKRVRAIMLEIHELKGNWVAERKTRREAIVGEIRDAERRRDRLFEVLELHGKEAPNLGDLTKRLRSLKNNIDNLERALMELEEAPPINLRDEDVEASIVFLEKLVKDSVSVEKTRMFFSTFIEKIELCENSAKIIYRLDRLVNHTGFDVVHSKENWLPDLDSNQGPAD